MIQRWPTDGTAPWPASGVNDAAAILFGQSELASRSQAPIRTPPRRAIFQAMQACDGLDGVVDGPISNQVECEATLDPATAILNGVAALSRWCRYGRHLPVGCTDQRAQDA
jgi:hypothetical protein